jgi:FixJ family two-component response regulator
MNPTAVILDSHDHDVALPHDVHRHVRSNKEVAAALFLSPKTVEHHLGAVLRKRGLRSRTELARALAVDSGDDGAAEQF